MLGCYDFNGHYDWTFEWFRKKGGEELTERYWVEAIADDCQSHAGAMIKAGGFEGMKKYWGFSLEEEGAGCHMSSGEDFFRIDMSECPSLGILLRNKIKFYHDYCEHCVGWVAPVVGRAGFVVYSEHDHGGRCYWEFRRKDDTAPERTPEQVGAKDVRNMPDWDRSAIHRFAKSDPAKFKGIKID